MRRYREELINYLRYKKHVSYVESFVLAIRNKLCRDACTYGNVDKHTRYLYLKYNNYLIKLRNGRK